MTRLSLPLLVLALAALRPAPAGAATPAQTPAAAPAQAPAAKVEPDGAAFLEADPDSLPTPPGRREDQALWGHTLEAGYHLLSGRYAARQLLFKAVGGRFDERLAQLAQGPAGDGARKAGELHQRVREAYAKVYENVSHHWGVDWRLGCRSQAIDLEGAMRSAGTVETGELRQARQLAQECSDRASRGARAVRESSDTLQAALAEAEAFLAASALAPAQPAQPAGATDTAPAAR